RRWFYFRIGLQNDFIASDPFIEPQINRNISHYDAFTHAPLIDNTAGFVWPGTLPIFVIDVNVEPALPYGGHVVHAGGIGVMRANANTGRTGLKTDAPT